MLVCSLIGLLDEWYMTVHLSPMVHVLWRHLLGVILLVGSPVFRA